MTPLEQGYYLQVLDYLKKQHGNGDEDYSSAPRCAGDIWLLRRPESLYGNRRRTSHARIPAGYCLQRVYWQASVAKNGTKKPRSTSARREGARQ